MADSLPDLVARLRAHNPMLADVPDDVLTAEVLTQLRARGGPSVGDALDEPTFRTSNLKTPGGDAVVRDAPSPWTKATGIGAPRIGEHYTFPSVGEVLASEQPLQLVAQFVTGHGRPRSVANADPLGVTAFHEGKAPPPLFLGTTEEVGAAVGDVLGAGGRGLYSRVDDAVSRLPAKGAHPNKIAGILKSNASAEELAYRQVPEFLAAKGNATVTPGELQAHLEAHPAPLPVVKTLAVTPRDELAKAIQLEFGEPVPATPQAWTSLAQRFERGAQQWQRNGDAARSERLFQLSEQATEMAEGLDLGRGLSAGQPKYAQYQLPGGEAYQETLLTLPEPGGLPAGWRTGPSSTDPGQIGVFNPAGDQVTRAATADAAIQQAQSYSTQSGRFRSSHFDEPNLLVHTRSNTRTLPTGERGRFVEEVQSDWHQAGKDKGYALTGADRAALEAERNAASAAHTQTADALSEAKNRWKYGTGNPEREALDRQLYGPNAKGLSGSEALAAKTRQDVLRAEDLRRVEAAEQANNAAWDTYKALDNKLQGGVPDAPFKETWPDLGLKQQLLEAAKDPDAQWLGFTSGQTQAARYDLSKQIDELKWYRDGDGYRISARKDGQIVAQQSAMSPQTLSATVGKEMAQKIVAQTEQHGVMSGLDLQVGGEGMHHFYDELLPKRLQKIVKPFGGTVERTTLSGDPSAPADVVARYANQPDHPFTQKQQTPAWIVRLTPAMKARILKEGLPLSLLLGAAGPSVLEALRSAPDRSPQ